ncbi:MAG: CapA family protein, partial [Lachnospiraceae bacterium]|nr:CapA family protein [Lachnospiraceae bacterium]
MLMHKTKIYIVIIAVLLSMAGCNSSKPNFDNPGSTSMTADKAEQRDTVKTTDPADPDGTSEGTAPADTDDASSANDSAGSEELPPQATEQEITLLMVGDILLHTPVEKSAKREDGSYGYDAIFENTKDLIGAADLALVNQEVILGGAELGISGYPRFNAPYEIGTDLVEAGFDVICHATNHAI